VLGEDLGQALGCGAHLQMLRRTGVGVLTLQGAMTLEALAALPEPERAAVLAPVDALLSTFPSVSLDDELARRFLHGQRLALGRMAVAEGRARVYRESDGKLLGTARMAEYGVLAPERLIAA
jgi:tRNA pseudouridine55 synthase